MNQKPCAAIGQRPPKLRKAQPDASRQLRSAVVPDRDVRVRLANESDIDDLLDVCAEALGWSDPEFDRALFRWKHITNAFGASIILVAEDENGLLAVRPMMQWRFRSGDDVIRAARAVDTATRPRAQGRGLFRTLTEASLVELADQSFGFVFNTPNDKSRPGYLKMGWETAGQIGFGFGLGSVKALPKIARSRTAANKRSIETPELGVDVGTAIESMASVANSDATTLASSALRTDHSPETLRWRFADGPISYRWLSTGVDTGVIVRLRARGASRELVVAYHTGGRPTRDMWELVHAAMRQVRADYCLAPAGFGRTRTLSTLGPTLTLRKVITTPRPGDFLWQPGDIELF